ncbi:hypothetical protein MUK42_02083 [Musa troglodytarum]|uniref:Uncharacterized protein n=1 Tax=Musa troglodytarum TaxID=320322 RepID=A0A9E7FWA8_9LILI|nr:hypothetical protein MUK42_02083 [Musa troglodytarum]
MAAFAPAPKGGGRVAVKKTSLHPPCRCSGKCNHMPFWFPFLPSHCHQSTKEGNKLFGFPLSRIKISIQICFHSTNKKLNLNICAGKREEPKTSFLWRFRGRKRDGKQELCLGRFEQWLNRTGWKNPTTNSLNVSQVYMLRLTLEIF